MTYTVEINYSILKVKGTPDTYHQPPVWLALSSLSAPALFGTRCLTAFVSVNL